MRYSISRTVLFAVLLAFSGQAMADLIVCNKRAEETMLWLSWHPNTWHTEGPWYLRPGECKSFWAGQNMTGLTSYVAVLGVTGKQWLSSGYRLCVAGQSYPVELENAEGIASCNQPGLYIGEFSGLYSNTYNQYINVNYN